MSKSCTKCKAVKEFDQFCKNKNTKDGYQSACKMCMNIAYNISRKKKQGHYQEVAAARGHAMTARMRAWKSEMGCLVCREKYPQCLELHHLDPSTKEADPASLRLASWDTFLKEAEKCVVLCANCHRKVHGGVIQLPL